MAADAIISSPDDVVMVVYDKDWTQLGEIRQHTGFNLKLWVGGEGTLTFRAPLDDLVDLGVYSILAENVIIEVFIRGVSRYVGIVVDADDKLRDGAEGGGIADYALLPFDVEIETMADWHWHLSGREVKGESTGSPNGRRYAKTSDKPNINTRDLIKANCTTGSVITPPEYAALSADRTDFGGHEVTAASSGTHPTTVPLMRWSHGSELSSEVAEACRRWDMRVASSWNRTSSPPLLTATVVYPRYGTDRTESIILDRERGGALLDIRRKLSRGADANLAEVQGAGIRENQRKGYAVNAASMATQGLREKGDLWPEASAAECDDEAEFIMQQMGGAHTTYEAWVRSVYGMVLGEDYWLGDKVTVYCSRRNITVQDYIEGVEYWIEKEGPLREGLIFGKPEKSPDQKAGRSGGGGGRGGGRKGGKPRAKGGEQDSVRKIIPNDGDDLIFDHADDELELKGEEGVDRIHVKNTGTDPGAGEDDPENIVHFVRGNYYAPCPTCTGYVPVYAANLGRNVWLLTSDALSPPGAGGSADSGQ